MSGTKRNCGEDRGRLRLIAYVYPGWHASSYRPGVNEWDLLETFQPYFEGHTRPPAPVDGPYDDSDPRTVAEQVAQACGVGIEAFTYFTYYRPGHGFVMSAPMDRAYEHSEEIGEFSVTGTWCIRLPYDRFPVPARDEELEVPVEPVVVPCRSLEDTPIELLTLRDLEELLGADDPSWHEITLGGMGAATRSRWRVHSVDSTSPYKPSTNFNKLDHQHQENS